MSRGGAAWRQILVGGTWTSTLLRDVIVSSKCTRRDMNVSVVKPSHVAAPALKQEPFRLLRFHFGVSAMPLRVTWTYERTFHCQSFVALCSLSLYLVVSFLPHAVNCGRFRFWRRQSVFCLCMKNLGNRWTDLRQIHTEDVFGLSLGRVWKWGQRSRSPGTKTAFCGRFGGLRGLCLVKHLYPLVLEWSCKKYCVLLYHCCIT